MAMKIYYFHKRKVAQYDDGGKGRGNERESQMNTGNENRQKGQSEALPLPQFLSQLWRGRILNSLRIFKCFGRFSMNH